MRALVTLPALLCALAVAAPAAAAPPGEVDVTFLQGEQTVTVTRPGTTADEAVRALVAGPTAEEQSEEITSTVPRKTAVRGVAVADGIATVDLGRRFAGGRRAEVLSARMAQLVLTVTAVPGVGSVQLLIDGGTPLGLFPGYATKFPITAADVRDEDVPAPAEPPPPVEKDPTAAARALQDRLADLGFLPRSGVDGQAGEQTRFAVMAFQKWARLDRDGVAGPRTEAALERARRPTPRTSGAGRRVEVLLDRQLALYVNRGRVVRTLHISSGADGFATPTGRFTVFRKERNSWSVPYKVWLPWASYFVGGVAFHESPDVPAFPASHGCVRVPRYDAQWLYDRLPDGTPVTVLATS
ncbi:MAG TPA: L,D-transpeptidase family protein [Solirubrobacteraceae bacterium]|nr:L,D-transpeptidase family protein [Solirubrobacteraceae bacterium]